MLYRGNEGFTTGVCRGTRDSPLVYRGNEGFTTGVQKLRGILCSVDEKRD